MHDFAELLFHAIAGLVRALWAACEFGLQFLAETGVDWLGGASAKEQREAKKRAGTNRI